MVTFTGPARKQLDSKKLDEIQLLKTVKHKNCAFFPECLLKVYI